MKKVFLDTNVLIDYLARREQFFEPAAQVVQLGRLRKYEILVSALSFATASFVLEAHHKLPNEVIVRMFAHFITLCNVTPVDSITIAEAIKSYFSDFEDAMQYCSAVREGADVIVTRNCKDFALAQIPVYEPAEFIRMLIEN